MIVETEDNSGHLRTVEVIFGKTSKKALMGKVTKKKGHLVLVIGIMVNGIR